MNYYIQGNKDKADQIKAAFGKLGYDVTGFDMHNDNILFFTYKLQGGGQVLSTTNANLYTADIIKTHPDYKELELPIEPCFKVGNKIEATIYGIKRRVTIREVDKTNRCYFGTLEECIGFSEQDQWHLAPKPHYDISNFHAGMPVLVRIRDEHKWCYVLFSHRYIHQGILRFHAGGAAWRQCIPFNDETKHLLGTTDPCDEQYINWQAIEL